MNAITRLKALWDLQNALGKVQTAWAKIGEDKVNLSIGQIFQSKTAWAAGALWAVNQWPLLSSWLHAHGGDNTVTLVNSVLALLAILFRMFPNQQPNALVDALKKAQDQKPVNIPPAAGWVLLAILCAVSVPATAQDLPDTYIATGAVANIGTPYNPAPFVAAGTLVTSAASTVPIYAGMRYELYRDANGQPAYAGLATVKALLWRKGRFFRFGDGSVGGAGSVSSISAALNAGGGAGFILSKSATPHWEIEIEPRATRVTALQNGTTGAVLIGVSYTFNRPK